jgi:hypothetical protein
MRFNGLNARLAALEHRTGTQEVELRFADGSTRAVRVADPLGSLLAAFRRTHARSTGAPAPVSTHDELLDLAAAATGVTDDSDPLLALLQEEATKGKEVKQQ